MTDRQYDFVVFSDDWGRHASSTQRLFTHIMHQHRVLWINTIGMRCVRADAFTLARGLEKIKEWQSPLRTINDNLHVLSPVMLPAAGSNMIGRVNTAVTVSAVRRAMKHLDMHNPVLLSTVPNAANYIGQLGESMVVYYVTDDYSQWPGSNADTIQQLDTHLTRQSDLVLACSQPLEQSHRPLNDRTVLFPHGVDVEHFDGHFDEPEDLAGIPHPRACFFGLIYEQIDIGALAALARRMPHLQLVLIGPVKTNLNAFADMPNVHVMGPRPYEQLPAYLHHMDVLLVTYLADESKSKCGPLRIRECLAVGKPTVARRIPDLESLSDLLYLHDDAEQLCDHVRTALAETRTDLRQSMRQRVIGHSWKQRADELLQHVDTTYQQRHPGIKSDCNVTTHERTPPWNTFLDRQVTATIYHDPRWGRVLQRIYGHKPYYLTARRHGKVVGILPVVVQQSAALGRTACSVPYMDAAGILAVDDDARLALIREVRTLVRTQKLTGIELRQDSPLPSAGPCRTDKVTFRLKLLQDSLSLWEGLPAKVRNQVRKAQRAGLTTATGDDCTMLDQWYPVYLRNMRNLGSPPHSKRFFREVLQTFAPDVCLYLVYDHDQCVAGSLTLRDRYTRRVPWAACDVRYRAACANMLLYWTMLADACDTNAAVFDFGRSSVDSGTYRFKKQWHAVAEPLYWYTLGRHGWRLTQPARDNSAMQAASAVWRHMPEAAVRMIGPSLMARLS